jgi:hypothetical protein
VGGAGLDEPPLERDAAEGGGELAIAPRTEGREPNDGPSQEPEPRFIREHAATVPQCDAFSVGRGSYLGCMMLCFIEPAEAIRVMAESIGREARRSLLAEVIEAWVDDIPEEELRQHYARAVNDLDHEDLSMLAAWHATLEVGTPVASADFLVGAFEGLGEHKRDVLKLAARFRGDEAFLAGVGEEEALDIVLPWLSEERVRRLCSSALEIYIKDRAGTEN